MTEPKDFKDRSDKTSSGKDFGRRDEQYYEDHRYGLERAQDFDRNYGQNYGQSYSQSYGRDPAAEPSESSFSDEDIHNDIRDSLFDHLDEEQDSLSIDVSEGIVTLSGSVRTEETKALAQRWAAQIPGVTEVHNEILVAPELPIEPDISEGIETHSRRDPIRPEYQD